MKKFCAVWALFLAVSLTSVFGQQAEFSTELLNDFKLWMNFRATLPVSGAFFGLVDGVVYPGSEIGLPHYRETFVITNYSGFVTKGSPLRVQRAEGGGAALPFAGGAARVTAMIGGGYSQRELGNEVYSNFWAIAEVQATPRLGFGESHFEPGVAPAWRTVMVLAPTQYSDGLSWMARPVAHLGKKL